MSKCITVVRIRKNAKEIFRNRLVKLAELRFGSRAELARKLGVSNQVISSYARGKTTPDYDRLRLIANCLGVSIDYLLGNEKGVKCYEN